jgi:chromosome partitioning protein
MLAGVLLIVGSEKGGVGKSTVALHLVAEWTHQGHRVILVDADPERCASDALANEPDIHVLQAPRTRGLGGFLLDVALRADMVVVDLPPGLGTPIREAIRTGDALLIPVPPRAMDIRGTRTTLELARSLRGDHFAIWLVLNQLRAGTIAARTAREALEAYRVPILQSELGERQAVSDAAAEGRAVANTAPHSLAAEEFRALAKEVWDHALDQAKAIAPRNRHP